MSSLEFLDLCEKTWAPKLKLVSLVAEVEIKQAAWEKAARCLRAQMLKITDASRLNRFLRRRPATQVVVTVGVGTYHYEHGTFWPHMSEALGVDFDGDLQHTWGEAFLGNLSTLGLPSFDGEGFEAGSKYVGRIVMHTGMPSAGLPDFFGLVNERRAVERGLSPTEFVTWASERAASGKLRDVSMPVARFLRYGGDFAVDVVDRAFDLADAMTFGGNPAEIPLPERFTQGFATFQEREPDLRTARRAGRGQRMDVQPKLVVDPFGQGVLLRLPSTLEAPDGTTTWVVALDGLEQRVRTEPLVPGISEVTPQTDMPIPGPVRQAAVALASREDLRVVLSVVDDKAPLIAFGDDGVRLPQGLPLPARPTWLLFPGDSEDLEFEGEAIFSTESPLPPGWGGWCLQRIDLTNATAVWLGELQRPIRGKDTARIDCVDPVLGVRATDGSPVLGALPQVHLPKDLDAAAWQVSLLDADGRVVAHWRRDNADGEGPESIWNQVPRPVLGTFTIRVRGPWGRGASRTMTIVEGLSVAYEPSFRVFARDGLTHGTARVDATPGISLTSHLLTFRSDERDSHVQARAHGSRRTLSVTPPHMTVGLQTESATSAASILPLTLHGEDIAETGGTLVLSIGEQASPTLHYRASGEDAQQVPSDSGRAGVYRFDLSKLTDTLATWPHGVLSLDDEGRLIVAKIRPRTLFSKVRLAGRALCFEDCVDVDGLTAYVYATRAPWRDPAILAIRSGAAVLPSWLHDAGPLLVSVRIDDPWVPEPIPDWPEPRGAALVAGKGWVTEDDEDEQRLSAYLAGARTIPEHIHDLSRLWTVRAYLPALALGNRTWTVGEEIDARLGLGCAAALAALPSSKVATDAIPEMLIRTGLACAHPMGDPEALSRRWTIREALTSVILASGVVWREEILAAAEAVGGDTVHDLVILGRDAYAKQGRLDAFADNLRRSPEQRDGVIREAALVPKGLISGDARVIAAMEYIARSHDERLVPIIRGSAKLFEEIRLLLGRLDEHTVACFKARCPAERDRGWMVVPALSLGFALAARHGARGDVPARAWVERHRRLWVSVAEVVPQLVTIDLFIAELVVNKSGTSVRRLSA